MRRPVEFRPAGGTIFASVGSRIERKPGCTSSPCASQLPPLERMCVGGRFAPMSIMNWPPAEAPASANRTCASCVFQFGVAILGIALEATSASGSSSERQRGSALRYTIATACGERCSAGHEDRVLRLFRERCRSRLESWRRAARESRPSRRGCPWSSLPTPPAARRYFWRSGTGQKAADRRLRVFAKNACRR